MMRARSLLQNGELLSKFSGVALDNDLSLTQHVEGEVMKEQYGPDEIGELLKQVQLETGISRRELAEKLGCSESTIKRLETGVTAASKKMWNRCTALALLGQKHVSGNAEEIGVVAGATTGVPGAVAAVSGAGTVSGLSAAGMTSGLAALGLGTMVTGIGVAAAIPIATGLASHGVVKGIKSIVKANKLNAIEMDDVLEIRLPGFSASGSRSGAKRRRPRQRWP